LSWIAQAYIWKNGRERRYKEEEGVVLTCPSRTPSFPK